MQVTAHQQGASLAGPIGEYTLNASRDTQLLSELARRALNGRFPSVRDYVRRVLIPSNDALNQLRRHIPHRNYDELIRNGSDLLLAGRRYKKFFGPNMIHRVNNP